MLQINGITKSFGPTTVLDNISFLVNPGEKVALVGPNGSGKSTILNIVSGDLDPDSGSIHYGSGLRVCYLRQGLEDEDHSVESAACSVVLGGSEALRAVRETERLLADTESDDSVFDRYSEALERLESSGTQHLLDRLDEALRMMNLHDVSFDQPVSTLSGGQKSRVALAGVIAAEPDVLLLDEPTNHLDLPALE